MNVDGTNLRLGRMATVVAKKALNGEEIKIFNSEKVAVTAFRISQLCPSYQLLLTLNPTSSISRVALVSAV